MAPTFNTALNAAIALIEGRPAGAREFLRESGSARIDLSQVEARLYAALDKACARRLRELLMKSLHLTPKIVPPPADQKAYEEAFYDGVQAVEELFEDAIATLEK